MATFFSLDEWDVEVLALSALGQIDAVQVNGIRTRFDRGKRTFIDSDPGMDESDRQRLGSALESLAQNTGQR